MVLTGSVSQCYQTFSTSASLFVKQGQQQYKIQRAIVRINEEIHVEVTGSLSPEKWLGFHKH